MAPRSSNIRFRVDPRDVPPEKAARLLHLTLPEFEAKLDQLLARGFPRPDPTTGMYDSKVIHTWMTARHQLDALTDTQRTSNAQEVFADRSRRLLDGN